MMSHIPQLTPAPCSGIQGLLSLDTMQLEVLMEGGKAAEKRSVPLPEGCIRAVSHAEPLFSMLSACDN